jgi:murein DD-endopeptidase MepM/ murein hydrolase activator NlpD
VVGRVVRVWSVVVMVAAAAMIPASAAPAATTRDPLTIAREKLDSARSAASDAAEELAAAESARAQSEDEIARLEQQIPELQAQVDALRTLVRQRAAALYLRGGTPSLDVLVSVADPLQAARASHLTNVATVHDVDLAAQLRQTTAALTQRENALRSHRVELDRVINDLTDSRALLDHKLTVATMAYAQVRQVLNAQRAGGGATGSSSSAMRCPVDGFTVFADDFGQPREDNATHQGIDMAASLETPLVAVADGDIVHDESAAGGHGIWLYDTNGDGYYYAHLSRYEGDARHVSGGDVVGYVGVTGITTGPHLHFEAHPRRGDAIDAYPLLLALCVDEMALPPQKPA